MLEDRLQLVVHYVVIGDDKVLYQLVYLYVPFLLVELSKFV